MAIDGGISVPARDNGLPTQDPPTLPMVLEALMQPHFTDMERSRRALPDNAAQVLWVQFLYINSVEVVR
ncbi:uncharacterized protein BDCG_17931 [Blastomyces dermatitidis ER-3]|uniref:Uncharacterized protein n=1 Tax=Ajellomyces dermatitidis (strain ER-3 / ATCC MYA-2586) TaxID=559297 RepID=A0ABX2W156_AJEDR|nr:uncharacterized protein BDCG_17931 [Blastomyces dermatitidis ER-3]OAT03119.1 hypothetical protein BDCG_17931 [Blastomyces dermatitidis ER-3]